MKNVSIASSKANLWFWFLSLLLKSIHKRHKTQDYVCPEDWLLFPHTSFQSRHTLGLGPNLWAIFCLQLTAEHNLWDQSLAPGVRLWDDKLPGALHIISLFPASGFPHLISLFLFLSLSILLCFRYFFFSVPLWPHMPWLPLHSSEFFICSCSVPFWHAKNYIHIATGSWAFK